MMEEKVLRAEVLKQYTAYVPRLVLKDLYALKQGQQPQSQFETALLFADISGFTALTEKLASQGPGGMEQLTQILNAYFGQMIATIDSHGGDIIKFAGDAMLAVWPAIDGAELADCQRAALQCGLAVHSALRDFKAPDGTKLALKIAVSGGALRSYHIGGNLGRKEFTVTGPALTLAGDAGGACPPDSLVCHKSAWQLVADDFVAEDLDEHSMLVTESRSAALFSPLPLPSFDDELLAQLKSYIPGAVHNRLNTGQGAWLGELRRVSVLFINLPDMKIDTSTEIAQEVMDALQRCLYRYEGSINKLSVDDKGVSLLAALGLPPLAHNDDPVRAVLAAMDMQQKLEEWGWQCAIGISSGKVFCGTIGDNRRREYTLMGDSVNLAARLMQASKGVGILCDEVTYLAASEEVEFLPHPALQLKGKANRIANFQPLKKLITEVPVSSSSVILIGRAEQRKKLLDAFDSLMNGTSSIAVVSGEAGIGKTALLTEVRHKAKKSDVTNLRGFASAIESATPYYVWSLLLGQLFSLSNITDLVARQVAALDYLADNEELVKLLPLLSDMLSLNMVDNEITSQISGEARADNINDLIINIIKLATEKQPVLLTIENAQWVDSASWGLLRLIMRDVHPLLLLLVTRPIAEPLPKVYRAIISSPDTLRLDIGALEQEESLELVCQQFGVNKLPSIVEKLISEKSQGNPFFIEELAKRLLETEVVVIKDNGCELASGINDLDDLNLPDTLEGLITERIDRLGASQQLALKVASVIGHAFRFNVLRDIFPLEDGQDKLQSFLDDLVRLDLMVPTKQQVDESYVFKQYLTGEVAYNMLLFSQREQLHSAVGEWYERDTPDNLAPFYSLLVYHFSRVGDDERTLKYCVKAGERAVRTFANLEALKFYEQALELDRKSDSPVSDLVRGEWHLQMGEVYYSLANFQQSREHIQMALSLLGQSADLSKGELVKRLLKDVSLQFMHRLWPKKYVGRGHAQSQLLLGVSRAYERLAQIAYMGNDKPVVLYGALRALNLSEEAGTSPELARSLANICVVASMIPSRKLAEMYYRLAHKTARETNNLQCQAYTMMVTAIYRTTTGGWQDIHETIIPGIEIAERIGDHRRWDELMFTLAPATYRLGKHTQAIEQFKELYESGLRRGIMQIQAWGLTGMLYSSVPSGNTLDIEEKLRLIDFEKLNVGDQAMVNGVLSHAAYTRGDMDAAKLYADRTIQVVKGSDAVAQYVLEGLVGAADVLLSMWESEPSRTIVMKEPMQILITSLQGYSKTNTIGLPETFRCLGRVAWLDGKQSKAIKLWKQGLEKAVKFDMRYEQALLRYELGQHLDGEQSRNYLLQARDSFDIMGAEINYQKVNELLSRQA